MCDPINYYRYDRYLDEGIVRYFALVTDAPGLDGPREYRFDDDHWTQLDLTPVQDRLFGMDVDLHDIPESDAPVPLTPETAVFLPPGTKVR